MTVISSQPQYRKFPFTYRFDGVDCCIEIPALSLEEAKLRLKVLGFARYEGDARPSRAEKRDRKPRGWFRSALKPAA